MDWRLLSEERPAYGVTEIADALGVKAGTVRQWLFRAKRHVVWGYPSGFPDPDTTIGGRPVWLNQTISSWLALRILAVLDPTLDDREKPDLPPETEVVPRYELGRYAFERAERTASPLVIALAALAAEADREGLTSRQWKSRVTASAGADPQSGYFIAIAIRELRRRDDLWPWGDA